MGNLLVLVAYHMTPVWLLCTANFLCGKNQMLNQYNVLYVLAQYQSIGSAKSGTLG